MKARRILGGLAMASGAAAALLARKRSGLPRERVDLYLSDGTLLTLEGGTVEAERMLPFAREILSAAR